MKKEKENNMDNYFYEGLEDLNIVPPAEVWDKIAGQLPATRPNRKLLVWIALAASVAIFAAISSWFLYQPNGSVNQEMVSLQLPKTVSSSDMNALPYSNKKNLDPKNILENKSSKSKNSSSEKPIDHNLTHKTDPEQNIAAHPPKQTDTQAQYSSNIPILTSPAYPPFSHHQELIAETMTYLTPRMELIPVWESNPRVQANSKPITRDTIRVYEPLYAFEETEEPVVEIDKWSIGGQIAPMYTYNPSNELKSASINSKSAGQSSGPMVTFSSGLTVGLKTSSKWSIETGLAYTVASNDLQSMAGYSASTVELTVSDGLFTQSGSDKTTSENSNHKLEYVEVPLLAKYKILDRKFNIHVLGGICTNVLVSNKSTNSLENYKTFNYCSSVGMGLGYKFGENLNFNLEPTFKYYLHSFTNQSETGTHPIAFGLYSGLFYNF